MVVNNRDRSAKFSWRGVVVGVQPRVRMFRSFDERSEDYLGHNLRIHGEYGGDQREFQLAIGKTIQPKLQFQVGDRVRGFAIEVEFADEETADLYKASGIVVDARSPLPGGVTAPPFLGVAPAIDVYAARGFRRLASESYRAICLSCMWASEMPVEIMIDKWDARKRKYRRETFCFGPKSCPAYRPGRVRTVPGRKGMTWSEDDWVDEQNTAHRGPDD